MVPSTHIPVQNLSLDYTDTTPIVPNQYKKDMTVTEKIYPKAIFYFVRFVSRKRPFSTEEAQVVLSYTVQKMAFSTQLLSTENFEWILQSKSSVEKVLPVVFEPIASLISPRSTPPHPHTPIPRTTQQYHTTALTLPLRSMLLLVAASQRGARLAPLASSVYRTTAVARVIDAVLQTTAACCSVGGSRPSATQRA